MTDSPVFTIVEIENDNSTEIIIKNNLTKEFVSILPGYGARIKELWLKNGGKNISIIKKVTNIDSESRDDIFNNAKLSPFAGRIKDGKYVFNDTGYSLLVNYPEEENACHGFIYNKDFILNHKLINEAGASCSFIHNYNGEHKGYPFKYTIEINYNLTLENGLICSTKVTNNSKRIIPLSDGWHHYYDLGVSVDDLQLKLDVSNIIELDSRNIPTEKRKSFNEFDTPLVIRNRSFDSCFKVDSCNGKSTTQLISTEQDIHLNIWQETGTHKYEYLVIYTPPDRGSIAIEPMTSNVDSFNNGEGLIKLSPDEEYISSFGIYLSRNGSMN